MDTTRGSLLLRIRDANDEAAWRDFDAIYRPMLYRFARSRGLPDAEAEDVVQHCMAAIQAHIPKFEYDPQKGRFKAWVRTLVNNRVRSLLRKRREQEIQDEDLRQVQQREVSPEESFDRVWMEEHLRHALRLVREELDSRTFTAFEQYAIEERPADEVCREVDMTPNQLYKIKWRVTRKLADQMAALLGGAG